MPRFLILFVVLVAPLMAWAQKVVVKSVSVANGQSVVLDLKHATTIRIRPATDNHLRLQATVQINQNKLNDAFLLTLATSKDAVRVASDLNKKLLATAQPGDCPAGGAYYGNWSEGQDRAPVCAGITFDVSLPPGTSLRVNTISGNIDVRGLTGELQAKSVSGFVDVSWPASSGAQVILKTITGEVYSDLNLTADNQRSNPSRVGHEMKGNVGAASGPVLRLESIKGNVYLRKAK